MLFNITIPNGVKFTGSGAFSGCSSLTSIEIPGSVRNIGYDVFENCGSLTIQAPAGGYIEGYAKRHKIPFKAI